MGIKGGVCPVCVGSISARVFTFFSLSFVRHSILTLSWIDGCSGEGYLDWSLLSSKSSSIDSSGPLNKKRDPMTRLLTGILSIMVNSSLVKKCSLIPRSCGSFECLAVDHLARQSNTSTKATYTLSDQSYHLHCTARKPANPSLIKGSKIIHRRQTSKPKEPHKYMAQNEEGNIHNTQQMQGRVVEGRIQIPHFHIHR